MTTDTRYRIQLTILDESNDPLSGLRAKFTRLRGSSPLPYSLTEDGLLFRDTYFYTRSDGTIDVWITDSAGGTVTVFFSDDTIAYKRDLTFPFEASGVGSVELAPVPVQLILKTASSITVDRNIYFGTLIGAVLIYSNGTVSDVTAELEGESDDEDIVTVTGNEVFGVAEGSAILTFTIPDIEGAEDMNAELSVDVEIPQLVEFFAGEPAVTLAIGDDDLSVNTFAVLDDGTLYNNSFPDLGVITSVSSNVAVATSSGRVITPVGLGTCNVTLTLSGIDSVVAVTVVAA
jgi:hypothetical protein